MINSAAQTGQTKLFSKTIMVALFAAFICAGSFIHIPLPGGVPVAIQDMMAMLAGLLLGPLYGGLSVLLFLALGCVGLPVFTGKAGIHVIISGPTGGFLVGYLFGAIVGGLFLQIALREKSAVGEATTSNNAESTGDSTPGANAKSHLVKKIIFATIAALLATIVVFAIGIAGFMRIVSGGISKALTASVIPFIPGNVLKIVVMVPLTVRFRPILKNYLC